MNKYIKTTSTSIDILDKALYNYKKSDSALVLFDNSQSILKDRVIKLIWQSHAFKNFLKSLDNKQLFDVNMSKIAKEMYEKGEWFLKYSKSKDGFIPMLCDQTGKFKEQVTLNPKYISQNLSNALANLAMQQQLGQLMDQIEILSNSIQRIERGQIDDRIALFYSARQKFIEGISLSNPEWQAQALLNTIQTANDARYQLMQTMRSDIDQIINNNKMKKAKKDELSNNVRDAMWYINEATGLCVMCYSALGENKSMIATLLSYQCFIEQSLLAKINNETTIAIELHRNWNGTDNNWLEEPIKIVNKLDVLIKSKIESPILIVKEGYRFE